MKKYILTLEEPEQEEKNYTFIINAKDEKSAKIEAEALIHDNCLHGTNFMFGEFKFLSLVNYDIRWQNEK